MVQAIETWYAGCKFRSRLEARWAVFFDTLGIGWEYEKQGFMVGKRMYALPKPYLPDFFLPGIGIWAEVKGRGTQQIDCRYLCSTAMELAEDDSTGSDRNCNSLLLLGDIPNLYPGRTRYVPGEEWHGHHTLLGHHKGDCVVRGLSWSGLPDPISVEITDYSPRCTVATDSPVYFVPSGLELHGAAINDENHSYRISMDKQLAECFHSVPVSWWSDGVMVTIPRKHDNEYVSAAYKKARSARFEHGQSGTC